jgi:hypothetical protein
MLLHLLQGAVQVFRAYQAAVDHNGTPAVGHDEAEVAAFARPIEFVEMRGNSKNLRHDGRGRQRIALRILQLQNRIPHDRGSAIFGNLAGSKSQLLLPTASRRTPGLKCWKSNLVPRPLCRRENPRVYLASRGSLLEPCILSRLAPVLAEIGYS